MSAAGTTDGSGAGGGVPGHRRRPRYPGRYPRKFEHKYKERDPGRHADTVLRVMASGKTPAGMHRPILVEEVMGLLVPSDGDRFVDCTLGHGGHAGEILRRLAPGGRLLGLDMDPVECPRAEARLRAAGFGSDVLRVRRCNFAGLPAAMAAEGFEGADGILADLGVSSMQLDDPVRGFSFKHDGPLDMRMNPGRSVTAAQLVEQGSVALVAGLLEEHADEPRSALVAAAIAGRRFDSTLALSRAVRGALGAVGREEQEQTVRRTFQALRIAVNDELTALDTLLRHLPACLRPGGRVVILTFHSGEDRRVKRAFESGLREGWYAGVSEEVIRPSPEERRSNPRSAPAKLRWARAGLVGRGVRA